MCYKIESSFILIHKLKNRVSCSISDIVNIKRSIENEIPSVYVDVSKNSILQAISCYPEIFEWEGDSITKKQTSTKFFTSPIIDFFSDYTNRQIEPQVIKIIEANG
jgi:hypothetical protein